MICPLAPADSSTPATPVVNDTDEFGDRGAGSISFTNDLHEKTTVNGDDSFSDGATDDDSLTTTTDDSGSEALSLSNGFSKNTSFTNHDQEVRCLRAHRTPPRSRQLRVAATRRKCELDRSEGD